MKYILALLLLVVVMCGISIADTSSIVYLPGETHRVRQADNSWLYYINGTECAEEEYWIEDAKAPYSAQALIGWAMENYPALIGTPHEAALVAFANDPAGYKDLLVARGAIIDSAVGGTQFSDLAQAIIVEARTLGAKGLD